MDDVLSAARFECISLAVRLHPLPLGANDFNFDEHLIDDDFEEGFEV